MAEKPSKGKTPVSKKKGARRSTGTMRPSRKKKVEALKPTPPRAVTTKKEASPAPVEPPPPAAPRLVNPPLPEEAEVSDALRLLLVGEETRFGTLPTSLVPPVMEGEEPEGRRDPSADVEYEIVSDVAAA